jgi:hypothetical protein
MIKKTLLILAFVVVVLAIVSSVVVNNKNKRFVIPDNITNENQELNNKICPAVCVSLWELDIINNICTYNDCGTGCGVDNITTFETEQECLNKIN